MAETILTDLSFFLNHLFDFQLLFPFESLKAPGIAICLGSVRPLITMSYSKEISEIRHPRFKLMTFSKGELVHAPMRCRASPLLVAYWCRGLLRRVIIEKTKNLFRCEH